MLKLPPAKLSTYIHLFSSRFVYSVRYYWLAKISCDNVFMVNSISHASQLKESHLHNPCPQVVINSNQKHSKLGVFYGFMVGFILYLIFTKPHGDTHIPQQRINIHNMFIIDAMLQHLFLSKDRHSYRLSKVRCRSMRKMTE